MNSTRVVAILRQIADLDAQRSELGRLLALAYDEPEPEQPRSRRRAHAAPPVSHEGRRGRRDNAEDGAVSNY